MLNSTFKDIKYSIFPTYTHVIFTYMQQANYSLSSFNTAQPYENDYILHNAFWMASSYFAHLG